MMSFAGQCPLHIHLDTRKWAVINKSKRWWDNHVSECSQTNPQVPSPGSLPPQSACLRALPCPPCIWWQFLSSWRRQPGDLWQVSMSTFTLCTLGTLRWRRFPSSPGYNVVAVFQRPHLRRFSHNTPVCATCWCDLHFLRDDVEKVDKHHPRVLRPSQMPIWPEGQPSSWVISAEPDKCKQRACLLRLWLGAGALEVKLSGSNSNPRS